LSNRSFRDVFFVREISTADSCRCEGVPVFRWVNAWDTLCVPTSRCWRVRRKKKDIRASDSLRVPT